MLAPIKPERWIERGVKALLYDEPFFGTLLIRTGRVPVGPEITKIAATDGKRLFYNPEAVAGLTFDQLRTVLAHETMHNAMGHPIWMIGKNPDVANRAADYVVNAILRQSGYVMLDGMLYDKRFDGKTVDQTYAILMREKLQQPPQQQQPQQNQQQKKQQQAGGQPQPQPGGGQGKQPGKPQPGQGKGKQQAQPSPAAVTPGGVGQILPCPKDEAAVQAQEWKNAVEEAAVAARAVGKLPGHLKRVVEEIREAKVNWAEILKQFVANLIPTDFTWSRPSKRTLSQGIYLPSTTKEGLADLVFCLDNSGSCTSYIPPFCSEVAVVHQDLKPSKLTMLCHDTQVYNIGEFAPGDQIEFKLKGGGGTDFRPVFEYVNQMEPAPRALILLTDLYGPLPKYAPDYPVLFVCTSKQIAPWGETVRIDL